MPDGYLPIFIFLICATIFPLLLLVIFQFLRPKLPSVT